MFAKKLGTYYNPDLATIFLVKDVTASQGSQKQEKGEKVPDRLGFLFLLLAAGGSLVKIPELQFYHPAGN